MLACYRCIELNSVRARMVERPGAYRWSSYGANAHGGPSDVLTPHADYLSLGGGEQARRRAYRELFRH